MQQKVTVNLALCAVVNKPHLSVMASFVGLHPWSYKDENPFALAKTLDKQEAAIRKQLGIGQ